MFSDLVESITRPRGKRKGWAVVTSAAFQALSLLILIIIPLLYTEALPKVIYNSVLVAPAAPAPRAPVPVATSRNRVAVRQFRNGVLTAPTRIPPTVEILAEPELPAEETGATGVIGSSGLDLLNMGSDLPKPATQPETPKPPSVPQRVPVTSTIQAARLILRVQPVYPALAMQSRIQGSVVLHAIISKEGEVRELQVLSGHPLLVKAALDAVRQWRYNPTVLSGQAVEVETTITVSFVLGP